MASALELALAYLSQGKFAESEALAREAMEFGHKKQPDDWQRFQAESLLGASLAGQKKYADAEPLLPEGYSGMLARKDRIDVPDRYHLDRAHEWLVQLYQTWASRQGLPSGRKSDIQQRGENPL
jgi:eukaryotic-like serine/threonine-protein kinase